MHRDASPVVRGNHHKLRRLKQKTFLTQTRPALAQTRAFLTPSMHHAGGVHRRGVSRSAWQQDAPPQARRVKTESFVHKHALSDTNTPFSNATNECIHFLIRRGVASSSKATRCTSTSSARENRILFITQTRAFLTPIMNHVGGVHRRGVARSAR